MLVCWLGVGFACFGVGVIAVCYVFAFSFLLVIIELLPVRCGLWTVCDLVCLVVGLFLFACVGWCLNWLFCLVVSRFWCTLGDYLRLIGLFGVLVFDCCFAFWRVCLIVLFIDFILCLCVDGLY